MSTLPKTATISARAAGDTHRRRPGILVALLLIACLGAKISFWWPIPVLGMTVFPVAFAGLLVTYLALAFEPNDIVLAIRRSFPFFLGFLLVLVAVLVAYGTKANPYYDQIRIARIIEMGIAIYFAAMIFGRPGTRSFEMAIAWAGPMVSLYFVWIFVDVHDYSLGAAAMTFVEAVRTADPNQFIYRIVDTILSGQLDGLDIREFGRNTRHGWSGCLLVALLLSISHQHARGRTPLVSTVWMGLLALNVFLLICLLSRGVLVGAFAGYVVALLIPGRGKVAQVGAVVFSGVLAFTLLLVSGFGALLLDHFFKNTGSMEARGRYTAGAIERINGNVVLGADFPDRVGSAHNWVLDLWQGAGIVAMLGALTMLVFVLYTMSRFVLSPPPVVKQDPKQIYVVSALACLGTFVVIRYLTAGYGIIGAQEALGAGVFLALAGRLRDAAPASVATEAAPRPERLLAARWQRAAAPAARPH